MGLLGWGRWKLWKSTWKVTDHDDHSLRILCGLLRTGRTTAPFARSYDWDGKVPLEELIMQEENAAFPRLLCD